jgi:alanine racemase
VIMKAGYLRPAWAEIDLSAIRHNATVLARQVAPAGLCAVVKAGGYGHGAPQVARAALDGGATWLAVALVEEGVELRDAGVDAPILLLSEPAASAMPEVVECDLTPTLYTFEGLDALTSVRGDRQSLAVHVKVDTGMHRVGAAPVDAVRLAVAVASTPGLVLEGFWTHLAVSDEVDNAYTADQIARYEAALAALAGAGIQPRLRHAANSGGALWHPDSRFDLVRCGIALYGHSPAPDQPTPFLRPAMSLKARVSYVKTVGAGERLSYGLRYQMPADGVVATVPLGYADGVTRGLAAAGGSVLIGGSRRPIAGTVTMDQILVDCGPSVPVAPGDEVVLLGSQGDAAISAWEWAQRTGTIAYEVVCGISGRVPRTYVP